MRVKTSPALMEEVEALVKALSWSQGFALYFAVANPPFFREFVSEEVKKGLIEGGIKVGLIRLSTPYAFKEIGEKMPQDCQALFITGVELILASEQRRAFLSQLNWQRDKFREISIPLVFWIPEFALHLIALEAPDFWAWRSGSFYFRPPEELLPLETRTFLDELSGHRMGGLIGYESLIKEEKIKQLQGLKGLLAEYESLPSSAETKRLRLSLLKEIGSLHLVLGELKEAKKYLSEAKREAESEKNYESLADILPSLGLISDLQGNKPEADKYAEEICEVISRMCEKPGVARRRVDLRLVLSKVGVAYRRGDLNQAEELLGKALELAKGGGNEREVALALQLMASSAQGKGEYGKAENLLKQSREIYKGLSEFGEVGSLSTRLSRVAREQKDYEKASQYLEEALQSLEETGDEITLAEVGEELAELLRERGDYTQVREVYREALEIYEKYGDKRMEAQILLRLGSLLREQGDFKEAGRCFRECLKISEEIGYEPCSDLARNYLERLKFEEERIESGKEDEGI